MCLQTRIFAIIALQSAVVISHFQLRHREPRLISTISVGIYSTIVLRCLLKAKRGTYWFIRFANIYRTTTDVASTKRVPTSVEATPRPNASSTTRTRMNGILRLLNKSKNTPTLGSVGRKISVAHDQSSRSSTDLNESCFSFESASNKSNCMSL